MTFFVVFAFSVLFFSIAYGVDEKKDIVDTAVEAGSFTILAQALEAADLVDVLKGEGPFTVFAPDDEAFAKLPDGTVEMLLKPENKDLLVTVLTYHVVPGEVLASDVVKLDHASTVQGEDISIKVEGDKVVLNGKSTVTAADIEADNGVIHVIDTVIMPPEACSSCTSSCSVDDACCGTCGGDKSSCTYGDCSADKPSCCGTCGGSCSDK